MFRMIQRGNKHIVPSAVALIAAVLLAAVSCRKSPPLPGDADAPIGLAEAARQNNAQRMRVLLKRRANVNKQDEAGGTPLMYAAACESVDCVRLLLDAGADLETRDMYGGTALLWAASGNAEDSTRLLVKAGANIEAKGSVTGEDIELTPLMFAAGSNFPEVAAVLIEAGADVDAWGVFACDITALMLAAYRNSADVATLLVKAGADVNIANSEGMTALSIAQEVGAEETAVLLRQAGAR